MRRYLLFAGHGYDQAGGWHDLVGDFDTIEEADARVALGGGWWGRNCRYGWGHIVDTEVGKVVRETGGVGDVMSGKYEERWHDETEHTTI
jgi:hypothetical protein